MEAPADRHMAENGKPGRKGGDDALILGLATGLSPTVAAERAGLGMRTAYRRLKDPDFRLRVAKARDGLCYETRIL